MQQIRTVRELLMLGSEHCGLFLRCNSHILQKGLFNKTDSWPKTNLHSKADSCYSHLLLHLPQKIMTSKPYGYFLNYIPTSFCSSGSQPFGACSTLGTVSFFSVERQN